MTNTTSIWESTYRQPSEDSINAELAQLRNQVASVNAKNTQLEGTIGTVETTLDARLDVLEPQPISLALANGWVNFGGGFNGATAVKQGRHVQLGGLISSGTTTANTIITTLPTGWRPPVTEMCACWCQNGVTRIDVDSGGNVRIAGETTTGGSPSIYLSLNLSFYTA